jgi:crotonobetaine/carnitine-CoA ligase
VITAPDAPDHGTLEKLIIETCRTSLADFKVPRAVYVVDEFPLGTLDKLLKNKLRDLADEQPAID